MKLLLPTGTLSGLRLISARPKANLGVDSVYEVLPPNKESFGIAVSNPYGNQLRRRP
jgi:hypothetical protein